MGSSGFLLLFMAVNIANVRLAHDTGGRAWICAVAALSTAAALIVLLGIIVASFVIEVIYRGVTGRDIHLVRKAKERGGFDKDD